eukprot:m.367022 g.367022  ORF g.367022 m.367022 type:complete len:145 (+) comp28097_c0_seq15:1468-1902(+)
MFPTTGQRHNVWFCFNFLDNMNRVEDLFHRMQHRILILSSTTISSFIGLLTRTRFAVQGDPVVHDDSGVYFLFDFSQHGNATRCLPVVQCFERNRNYSRVALDNATASLTSASSRFSQLRRRTGADQFVRMRWLSYNVIDFSQR